MHYRQVLPRHLISRIRDQISDQLALNKSRDCLFFKSDLDRAAVRFYRNNPDQLSLLQGMLPNLPAVYELALHPLVLPKVLAIGDVAQKRSGRAPERSA